VLGPSLPAVRPRYGPAVRVCGSACCARIRVIAVGRRGPVGFYAGGVVFDRITIEADKIEADKMAGQPCIRRLRIPVATVLAMVADGMTRAEILADLPELEAEDVAQALECRPVLPRTISGFFGD